MSHAAATCLPFFLFNTVPFVLFSCLGQCLPSVLSRSWQDGHPYLVSTTEGMNALHRLGVELAAGVSQRVEKIPFIPSELNARMTWCSAWTDSFPMTFEIIIKNAFYFTNMISLIYLCIFEC